MVLKVFNHISKIIFVCAQHESNRQVVNGGIFSDLSNQLLDAFSISRFLPGNQHQQMMDIQAWTWEYGDNINGILRSVHVFLACHVLILYYCCHALYNVYARCLCDWTFKPGSWQPWGVPMISHHSSSCCILAMPGFPFLSVQCIDPR